MSATGHFSLFLSDPEAGPRFDFDTDEVNIGRSSTMDLQIETPIVSGHHARIYRKGDQYVLVDEDSTNGTFHNGMPATRDPVPLHSGDEIRLGQTISLFFVDGDTPKGHSETVVEVELTLFHDGSEVASVASRPDPQFLVMVGRQDVHRGKLTGETITIGRAPDNDITVNSRFVSRYHARLERSGMGYRFVVLEEARNPAIFEGHPVNGSLQLRPGDQLQIGAPGDDLFVTMIYDPASSTPTKTLAEKHSRPTENFNINMDQDKLRKQVDQVTDNTFFRILKNDARRVRGRHQEDQADD